MLARRTMRPVCAREHQPSHPAELAQRSQQLNGEGAILVRVVRAQAEQKRLIRLQALGALGLRTRGLKGLSTDADYVRASFGQEVLGERVTSSVLGEKDRLVGPSERK